MPTGLSQQCIVINIMGNSSASPTSPQNPNSHSSTSPQKPQDGKGGFLSGLFFRQQNIGLNSVKQVSKTVDTNISKITQFFKQRQHYIQYFLYGSALFGVTFLSFYYQSIKVAKLNFFNTISRQKNNISKRSIANQAFNNQNNFSNNNLKVFKGKIFSQQTRSYQQVFNYYNNFKSFTRYPLLIVGEEGTGKTELLRNIFHEVRDIQFGQITYVDINVVTREAKNLSDILFFKYPEFKHYRKIFQTYSDEIKKPTILLDNLHLLTEFPNYNTILQEIQYYRWIESFNFLFASNYRQPQISFKINLIEKEFKGVMQSPYYQKFVESLNFGSLKEEIISLRPSVYILQDLYLCPKEKRKELLESIKYRYMSQLQYYNIGREEELRGFNFDEVTDKSLNSQRLFKDGLLRYNREGKIVYGSEFLRSIVESSKK